MAVFLGILMERDGTLNPASSDPACERTRADHVGKKLDISQTGTVLDT
jgi:hypothetical protein